ncbi:SMI1/KNR4 family protein [Plesiomonas shigelloides]|uniref:SMI1/KNR4 family protein n=1 Tax=Plesiomonas shigelloides TaxID=703 RepID=UPI00177D0EEC|nr:SMI1/KNR4 family protein [Plesiomonas shigelloides]QOH80948.1 SMI1/KNR4 family protein [Plesiomonas shigelloides]
MVTIFGNFDISNFWVDSQYAGKHYTEDAPTDATIADLESQLGYRIPRSYVELARIQNGGYPNNTYYRTNIPTPCAAAAHVAITGIYAIGKSAYCSLGGSMNTRFWVEEWGYPPIGIYFADCPSAGHDMIALDYRKCGNDGEPCVVHVDQECGYKITKLADTFEEFIRKLEPEAYFADNSPNDSPDIIASDSWLNF